MKIDQEALDKAIKLALRHLNLLQDDDVFLSKRRAFAQKLVEVYLKEVQRQRSWGASVRRHDAMADDR